MKPARASCCLRLGAVLATAVPLAAQAEVKQSSADGFFIVFSAPVAASAMKAYGDITRIDRWWDSRHTYSGKASHLSIKAQAGGCFCERWSGGSVEHGRVVMALPGKVLRVQTALGPLQALALKGILDFWVKTEDATTTLTIEYRVNGSTSSGLDKLAPSVDEVLGTQFERLRRFIATGNPEPPAEPRATDSTQKNARPQKSKPPAALQRRDPSGAENPSPSHPSAPALSG